MKTLIIKDNRIVAIFPMYVHGSSLTSLCNAHGITPDRVSYVPDTSPVAVNDDVREYSVRGFPLSDSMVRLLKGAGPDTSAVLGDNGWETFPMRRGWVYVDGSTIRKVESEWEEIPETADVFPSYADLLKNSLYGTKLAAWEVLRAEVDARSSQPIQYEGNTIHVSDKLIDRLYAISKLAEDVVLPWLLYEADPPLQLTPKKAEELLLLIVARNETHEQWARAIYTNEIVPAATPAEVRNVMRSHNLGKKLEELYG